MRPSRDKIIARVGAGTQAMLSLCGGGDANKLTDECISLYNEGHAPLVIRKITIHDADWASVHPVQEGLSLEGRTVDPMSPPASLDLFVRINTSVRGAHNFSGTLCISSNDPRPDILIPIEARFSQRQSLCPAVAHPLTHSHTHMLMLENCFPSTLVSDNST
eukprot:COSAG02_NODE_26176_length_639_cov_0.727778_1_plen_161_part_01